jgi:hypothetical protein
MYILMENMTSGGFSAGPHSHIAFLGGIGTSVDWLPYLLDLNLLGFSILSVLQEEVRVTSHANLAALQLSIAAVWDQLADIHKLPLLLQPLVSHRLER